MTDVEGMPRLCYVEGMTLREACLQASSLLANAGADEARAQAERLLMHVLHLERAELLRDYREPLPKAKWTEYEAAVLRKLAGEPLQYITGEQWFYGRPFAVSPAVLIPRPETELLVEAVLEAAEQLWPGAGTRKAAPAAPVVLDVGTGSGAIAVSLAAERPDWHICALDLSVDALAVARANAVQHGVASQIAWLQGDLLAPLAGLCADVLVSNPPYIPADDIAQLQQEVREYEPRLALDGGADGLDPYRRMLEQLQLMSSLPRIIAFEVGIHQAREVARMLEALGGWAEVRIIADYAGIERHVLAWR